MKTLFAFFSIGSVMSMDNSTLGLPDYSENFKISLKDLNLKSAEIQEQLDF
jgi:hypothetical protein